ncbi:MAG TPA: ATP-binding protein [Chitinispirillaceae bacterium]|nr:ATP-binding protein [Chitinispirillaceae bacterium]
MNIHALLPFISSLVFLTAGLVIYILNKENIRKPFLRFCYFTFHWQFTWFFLFSTGNESNAMLITHIGYSGIIFIPAAFYESVCSYLNLKTTAIKIIYLICGVFLITLWTTDKFIVDFYSTAFGYYPKAGFLHPFYMALVGYVFVKTIAIFTNKIRNQKKGANRSHITLYYCGIIIYSGAAIDYMLNYPDMLNVFGIQLYPLGVIFIILSIFLFLLAHKNRTNLYLEQKIKERTDELKNSLVLLKEAQESKKKFIASISHDLKNPLAVISGYALILKSKMSIDTKEYKAVNNITISVNQIERLLDSLIQVSLLESNELKPDLDIYNYSLFVDDYLKRFEQTAASNNVKLSWHNEMERIIVKSDMLWLERILGNLIQNAFKYVCKNGNIDVKVYTDQELVYTEVIDTGIGIPEDKLEFVFLSKYQAHKGLKKGGYGLGLSIVKEMLEILGGTIRVESQVDVGTRFIYTIPLYTDQNITAKNDPDYTVNKIERRSGFDRRRENRVKKFVSRIDESIRLDSLKKELVRYENHKKNCKCILICDDNPSHLQLLAEKLNDNYNLVLAENGETGLKKLSLHNSAIDAILTDVEMPVMNGIALCRKVKTTEEFKNIPVIMMSSFYNGADRNHALKNGAHCYIEKNKSKEEMVDILKTVFHQMHPISS